MNQPASFEHNFLMVSWFLYGKRGLTGLILIGCLSLFGCFSGDGTAPAVRIATQQVDSRSPKSSHKLDDATAELMAFNLRRRELVASLGRPNRLLIGLGAADPGEVTRQKVTPDIADIYLTGLGLTKSWRGWNKPDGEYLKIRLSQAEQVGAIPMFTVYQIAASGEGNLAVLSDFNFMQSYWSDMQKLIKMLKTYDKPVLLNIEPDFWGYTHRENPNPELHFAYVGSILDECGNLGNTVAAMAKCMLQITRMHAPRVKIGFPPSGFSDVRENEIAYMTKLGANLADFAIMQTGDRDAGCFEAAVPSCDAIRDNFFKYWDENNLQSPNFIEHFLYAKNYSTGIQLPLLWWQVSLGVPNQQPGGKPKVYRDNKVKYFLSHTRKVVEAGGFGVVFGIGMDTQTQLSSDRGQFKQLSSSYFSTPEILP